jgi:hypothetical protein
MRFGEHVTEKLESVDAHRACYTSCRNYMLRSFRKRGSQRGKEGNRSLFFLYFFGSTGI